MATFNLRRFASPDALKNIKEDHLRDFLLRHESYFSKRGVNLKRSSTSGRGERGKREGDENGLDYSTLAAVEASLPQFRAAPIQLIWGMKDWCFTHHFLDRFLESFPAAEVHRLADAGHYVMEDAPEQVIPLVEEFLEKHSAAGG